MTDTLRERVIKKIVEVAGFKGDYGVGPIVDAILPIIRNETLEEAARVCDEAEKRDRQAAKEPNDAEELAAFQRGAFMSRVNATAIRALKSKPLPPQKVEGR